MCARYSSSIEADIYAGEQDTERLFALLMGGKHYSRMRQSMEAMLKLKDGKAAAHQLAEHFREVYRRRPSFMAEISKF